MKPPKKNTVRQEKKRKEKFQKEKRKRKKKKEKEIIIILLLLFILAGNHPTLRLFPTTASLRTHASIDNRPRRLALL